MINWLEKALSYEHKQQWNGSETIWLAKLTDSKKSGTYRTQGVYLSHHRLKAQIRLHCTPIGIRKSEPSLMVFYLNSSRTKWIANPKINDEYVHWCIDWGIELGNIEFLWNYHLAQTTI